MKDSTKWNLITAGIIAAVLAGWEIFRLGVWALYFMIY